MERVINEKTDFFTNQQSNLNFLTVRSAVPTAD